MIIHSLKVENWKCFRESAEFEFSPAVNLIAGPNEAGKSTLIEAMTRGLFDKHTSSASELSKTQPWGTSLSPRVTVEFQKGENQYRIEKRFLSSARSILRRYMDGEWTEVHEGDRADQEVCKLFDTELYEHGASKPEHRGLAQLLWTTQGEFQLPDDLNATSRGQLQDVLGAVTVTASTHESFAEIDRRYSEIFTRVKGDYKKNSEVAKTQAQLDATREQLEDVEKNITSKRELAHEVQQLKTRLDKLRDELGRAEEDLKEKQQDLDAAREHREKRIRARSKKNDAENAYEKLDERVTRIDELTEAKKKKLGQLEKKQRETEALDDEIDTNLEKVKAEQQKLNEFRERQEELDDKLRNLRTHEDIVRLERDLDSARQKHEKTKDNIHEVEDMKSNLEELQAPNDQELEELRKLSGTLEQKRATLEALSLDVSFRAETAVGGTAEGDETTEFSLEAGEETHWTSPRTIALEFEGIGRLEARSGSEEAADVQEDVAELEEEYRTELGAFQADTLDEAIEKNRRRRNLESKIEKLEDRIDELIPDGMDALQKQINKLNTRLTSAREKSNPLGEGLAEQLENLDVSGQQEMLEEEASQLENEQEALDEKIERTESVLKKLQDSAETKKETLQETRERVAKLETSVDYIESELADLRDDGLTEEERTEKRKKRLKAYKEAQEYLGMLEEEVKEKEERPEKAYDRAERKVKSLREKERQSTQKLSAREERLRVLSGEGLYESKNELKEEEATLQDSLNRLKSEADAIKLLKHLKDHFQQETLDALVQPVRRNVEPRFRRLVGPKYEKVNLDRQMSPSTVTVSGWETEADSAELSFGTQEQLAFLVRLAIAEILAEEERTTVVLDDPLVNTDPARMDEALGIIEETADSAQMFILTCHESMYAGLDAKTLQLEK